MDVHLSAAQEHLVAEALRSGAFESADEVIERALEVLDAQNAWLRSSRETHQEKIALGLAQLNNGEAIPEDQLDEFLHRIEEQDE